MPSFKPSLSTTGNLPSKINRLHLLAVCLLITTSGALLRAQAQCTATAGTERICSPGSNATVTSPVQIVGASNLSPAATTTLIYIDFVKVFTASGPGVNTTLTVAAGTHHLTVQSFNGAWTKASEFFTVSSSTGGVSVSISPTSASLAPNATQQFTDTVSGSSNTSVTWSVDGVVGGNSTTGTISTSGLYTAPPTTGSHTVKATSAADTTKSASASVMVTSSTGCTATVDRTVNICSPQPNSTDTSPVQFTAAALDNEHPITAMKLYVNSVTKALSSGAQLSASVPLLNGTNQITIRAWDTSGSFFSSVETITVSSTGGGVSVSISPTSASLAPNATQQFTDTVSGSSNTSVTWSVDGVVGGNSTTGTISTSGLYTAPATTGSHTVKATSVADTTKSASASVMVTSSTGCTATVDRTVNICSPQPNSTDTSPVQFTAAALDNEHPITAMKLYVNSVTKALSSGAQLSASVPLLNGTNQITIRAWDTSGSFFSSVETITVSSTGGGVSVSISPTSASLAPNATQQFTDTVSGSSNTSVTWSVDGVVGGNSTTGTISTSGLYTAPAATGSHIVKATSVADSTKSASASVTVTSGPPPGNVEVLTSKNDNARSGLNPNETLLNPTTVASAQFHKLGSWTLDGFMQAQPLYVPGVQINGSTFNVLYVATENDSVYALNADAPGSAPLWHRSFLGNGVTIGTEFTGGTSIGPHIGITGTPVIDVSSHRLYVLPRTTENGSNVYHMHAIDIRNGADVAPPVLVQASVPGTGAGSDGAGNLPFGAKTQNQRPGLLLSNGVVYAGFASFNDLPPYNGWVIAFEANTLQ